MSICFFYSYYSFSFTCVVTKKVKASFPNVDDVLVDFAIECSGYDEDRAILFLSSMTPQDSDAYLPKGPPSHWHPDVTAPTVATQTGEFISVVPGSPVKIATQKVREKDKEEQTVDTCDVATWTKEDGIIQPPSKPLTAVKANPENKQGKKYQVTG